MDNDELTKQLLDEFNETDVDIDDNIENSEDDNRKRLNAFVFISFVMITGFQVNSKLIWVANEKKLYYKNAYTKEFDAFGCTCYIKGCNARIYIKEDGSAFHTYDHHHNIDHGFMYNIYKEMYCVNLMKSECLTAPPSKLISKIYEDAIKE